MDSLNKRDEAKTLSNALKTILSKNKGSRPRELITENNPDPSNRDGPRHGHSPTTNQNAHHNYGLRQLLNEDVSTKTASIQPPCRIYEYGK